MRRTFQACAGLILGGVLLSSVGCQSGGGWGMSPGGSWFSNWKAPTWPQPWSTGGGTSLASSRTLPSSSANPSQPQSSVTNPAPSGYASGGQNGSGNWGSGYPSSTQPPSGYDPNAGYAGANYNTVSANNGYGGGSNYGTAGGTNGYGNAGGNGGGNPAYAAPAAYQQPSGPPANNYQQETPYGGGSYNQGGAGGYNGAQSGQGGQGGGGYNTGSNYNTNGGGGYNGYQGSQNVQPPATGYQPLGYADPPARAGGYNEPAAAGNSHAEGAPAGAYADYGAAPPSNAAVDSQYQVQPVSAQEPLAQDPYANQPAEVASAPGGQGVLSGSASLPSSLSTSGGSYRPGSTGGTYMR